MKKPTSGQPLRRPGGGPEDLSADELQPRVLHGLSLPPNAQAHVFAASFTGINPDLRSLYALALYKLVLLADVQVSCGVYVENWCCEVELWCERLLFGGRLYIYAGLSRHTQFALVVLRCLIDEKQSIPAPLRTSAHACNAICRLTTSSYFAACW